MNVSSILLQEYLLPGEVYHGRFLIERKITSHTQPVLMYEAADMKEDGKRKVLSIHPIIKVEGDLEHEDEGHELARMEKVINDTIRVVQDIPKSQLLLSEDLFRSVEEYFYDDNGHLVTVMNGDYLLLESIIYGNDKDDGLMDEARLSIQREVMEMFNNPNDMGMFYFLRNIVHTEHYLRTSHHLTLSSISLQNIGIIKVAAYGGRSIIRPIFVGVEYRKVIGEKERKNAMINILKLIHMIVGIYKERSGSGGLDPFLGHLCDCLDKGFSIHPRRWLTFEECIISRTNNIPINTISRL